MYNKALLLLLFYLLPHYVYLLKMHALIVVLVTVWLELGLSPINVYVWKALYILETLILKVWHYVLMKL